MQEQPASKAVAQYFSASYREAREKFLAAALAAGAKIENFENPQLGPQGCPLFTDVVLVGARNARSVVVLVSGTHGVEGFAGSGLQTGLLREGIATRLGPELSIVMIHALNPYGFAHLRRCNEDNVDLNRNFVDHHQAYPTNAGYAELAAAISPRILNRWTDASTRLRLLHYLLSNGRLKLRQAISRGQFTHPQGLFFGGQGPVWANELVGNITSRYLSQAQRVVVVDVHTGLGDYGHAEVIINDSESSSAFQRAATWWGTRVKATVSGAAVSVHIQGTLNQAFFALLPGAEVTAAGLEFGTFSAREIFWALRAENWLYHYGGQTAPAAENIRSEFRHAFYPDSDDWKQRVWFQGHKVIEQALAAISPEGPG